MNNSMATSGSTAIDPTMRASCEQRNRLIAQLVGRLPGSIPYDNLRPVNVAGRFDGQTLFDVMTQSHPHISCQRWHQLFRLGRLQLDGVPVNEDQVVRGGQQYQHLFPNTVEPDVNAAIEIIWEDDSLVVVNKPAPLPMHPSGRFNLNTMTSLLQSVYPNVRLHPAHRLDANTTGVVVFSRDQEVARQIQQQFINGDVRKVYLVRCHHHPPDDAMTCDRAIGRARGQTGMRSIDPCGQTARTEFRTIRRCHDGTSLLHAYPVTGRTN
ncbi:MAG: RluA family pseudouridine synthase, partial [Pirellulaceae bacterium]|nr:RluA family pseudouridine synthase [Pirellulaceae bacterium]